MRLDPAGVPFVFGALAPAAGLVLTRRPVWAAPFLVAAGVFGLFFRDPERVSPEDPALVLAPADGRVLLAGPAGPGSPAGTWQQVSVFLSPLDVHVNRMPVSGLVTRVRHEPGRFLPAYRAEAAQENERTEVWIETGETTIVVRQVVGILARRIVCRVDPGAKVQAGQRFGIMKFGSRMDVFLPPAANLQVAVGDRVRAGETVIATLGG
jgi:phosphatidylserine decarboxylase